MKGVHLDPKEVLLEIHSLQSVYDLSISNPTRKGEVSETVPTSELITSPPSGGAFTGIMFGLYAFGNDEPCLDPADFSDISITQSETT